MLSIYVKEVLDIFMQKSYMPLNSIASLKTHRKAPFHLKALLYSI